MKGSSFFLFAYTLQLFACFYKNFRFGKKTWSNWKNAVCNCLQFFFASCWSKFTISGMINILSLFLAPFLRHAPKIFLLIITIKYQLIFMVHTSPNLWFLLLYLWHFSHSNCQFWLKISEFQKYLVILTSVKTHKRQQM